MGTQNLDLKWSTAEKTIARRAFDLALTREFDAITQEAKRRAANIKERSALWELEEYLTESRKEIDRKYDYRYSVLTLVFGSLIRKAGSAKRTCTASAKINSSISAKWRPSKEFRVESIHLPEVDLTW